MPMPFAGPIKARLACSDALPPASRLDFPAPARDEPKTEFPQHPALFPFELVIRRVSRTRIRLVGTDMFPTCMRHVERLMEEAIVQGKGVGVISRVSHFNAWYLAIFRASICFYGIFMMLCVSQNKSSNTLPHVRN
jgi:hypothetical protein